MGNPRVDGWSDDESTPRGLDDLAAQSLCLSHAGVFGSMGSGAVHDSGNRKQYVPDGGLRDRPAGKGRFDLVSPIAMQRLAAHYEGGAKKYESRNWEKGIPVGCCIDSLLRHAFQYLAGDQTEDHLAAVMWNAAAAIHIETVALRGDLPRELLDLPRHVEKPKTRKPLVARNHAGPDGD